MDGLCRAVAARAAKNRAATPILVALWSRLRRMVKRFDSLVARLRAGQLPAPPRARGPRAPSPRKPDLLPRNEAWVIHAVPESTVFASQLRHFLGSPEMAALLASDPRVGRILRPLCRMLAIESGPNTVPPPPGVRSPRDTPSANPAPPDHGAAVPIPSGEPHAMLSGGAESPLPGTSILLRIQN